jgi:hypothetical protein
MIYLKDRLSFTFQGLSKSSVTDQEQLHELTAASNS